MFEWWMLILVGVQIGWMLRERKHAILWFFKDVDNQLHMIIVGMYSLAVFGMVGMFIDLFLNVRWLGIAGMVCSVVFVAIMVLIYQPWKKWGGKHLKEGEKK